MQQQIIKGAVLQAVADVKLGEEGGSNAVQDRPSEGDGLIDT